MVKQKGPRILGVYRSSYGDENSLRVAITLKQLRKLPEWVYDQHVHWEYCVDDNRHCEIIIQAKDELEAMMRFKKLWAALSTIGE